MDGGSGGGAWSGGTEYEYDTRGRLWQWRDLAGGWTQVHYNAEDLPDSIAYPGGVTRMWMGYTARQAHEEAHFIFGTTHSFERSVRHSAFGVPDQTRWDIPSVLGAPDQIGEACRAGRVFN